MLKKLLLFLTCFIYLNCSVAQIAVINRSRNDGFFSSGDSLQIISNSLQDSSAIFIRHINAQFPPSSPPWFTQSTKLEKTITADTSFYVLSKEKFTLIKTGLYLLNDTVSQKKITLLVVHQDYPKLKKIENIIQPLVYISKKKENLLLQYHYNKKQAIDAFWLSLLPEDIAKNTIKKFYQRITQANEQFTSYKMGWKTDKGMVYIIFGKAQQIKKSNNIETWIYTLENDIISFDFFKKEIFNYPYFELQRNQRYELVWYTQVKKWREGKIY